MISILFISLLNYVLSVSTELDSLEVPFVTTSPHYLYSKRVTDDYVYIMDGNNNDIVLNTLTHQYIVLSIRVGYPSLEQPNYPNFFYSNTGVLLYVAENSRRFQVNTVIPLSLNGPTSVGLASHNFNYLNWKITYDSASIRLFVSGVEKASNLIVPPLDGSSGSIIFSTGLTLIITKAMLMNMEYSIIKFIMTI